MKPSAAFSLVMALVIIFTTGGCESKDTKRAKYEQKLLDRWDRQNKAVYESIKDLLDDTTTERGEPGMLGSPFVCIFVDDKKEFDPYRSRRRYWRFSPDKPWLSWGPTEVFIQGPNNREPVYPAELAETQLEQSRTVVVFRQLSSRVIGEYVSVDPVTKLSRSHNNSDGKNPPALEVCICAYVISLPGKQVMAVKIFYGAPPRETVGGEYTGVSAAERSALAWLGISDQ